LRSSRFSVRSLELLEGCIPVGSRRGILRPRGFVASERLLSSTSRDPTGSISPLSPLRFPPGPRVLEAEIPSSRFQDELNLLQASRPPRRLLPSSPALDSCPSSTEIHDLELLA
jgi:hypothetical protein